MLKDFCSEKFDIFIQAGQSNAYGFGIGHTDEPFWPDSRIWYMNYDFTVQWAQEEIVANDICGNYSLSFARKYIKDGLLEEGRKILILRAAEGSSGFLSGHWVKDGKCYRQMAELCKTALGMNPENEIVGILWHQGEQDAFDKATYDVHFDNLKSFVESVRKNFGTPETAFVAADFSPQWKEENAPFSLTVSDAIKDVCEKVGFAEFVETTGLKTNMQELGGKTQCRELVIEDRCHFSRRSLYILGERYLEAYKKIKSE